jgi:peptidoglycan/LPS O-acetylase OafA/YrhL
MGLLRTYLALAVVIGHVTGTIFGYQPLGGAFAVRLFYVISGFYMALVVDTKYGTSLRGSLSFWRNRYLRLAPSYWIVLAFALVLAARTEPSHAVFRLLPSMTAGAIALYVIPTVAILGLDALMFVGFDPSKGERAFHFVSRLDGSEAPGHTFLLVPQAWTLGVELLFYAIVPLLARQRTVTLVLVALASIGLRCVLYAFGVRYDPFNYRFFPTELVLFLFGMLAYRASALLGVARWSARARVAPLCLFATLVLLAGHYNRLALPILGVFPIVLPILFETTRHSWLDGKIGEFSYPIYISHLLFKDAADGRPLLACLLSIAFAALLLQFVEHPVDRYRQRWARRRAP